MYTDPNPQEEMDMDEDCGHTSGILDRMLWAAHIVLPDFLLPSHEMAPPIDHWSVKICLTYDWVEGGGICPTCAMNMMLLAGEEEM